MPRFFFSIRNSDEVEDFEGCECENIAAARKRAIMEARALAADDVKGGHLDLKNCIEVKDEHGIALFVVTFRDAVTINH